MAAAPAALLALPAAETAALVARQATELAKQRVIGWERVRSYSKGRKRVQLVTERTSFELQAWELAALGAVGLAAVWLIEVRRALGTTTVPWWEKLLVPGGVFWLP